MKQNHVFSVLAIVCVMAVIMSGCKKNEGDVVTMRGHAGQFGNGKVYMTGNLPMWTSGDTLKANDLAYSITVSSDGVAEWRMPSAAIYKAVYPASLVDDMSSSTVYMTIPKHQCYYEANGMQVINAPMGVCSSETDLSFKNLGALLAITINNNSSQGDIIVDKVTVKSVDNAIALCGSAVVENFTPSASEYYYRITDEPSNANSSVELVKGTSNPNTFASLNLPIAAGSFKVVYVYVPAVANLVANRYEITVDAHAGSENITVTRTQPAENAYAGTLQRNDMGSVNFQMEAMTYPEGSVEGGLFSVSATKKVFFANGNLQYKASTREWQFAPHQYDIIGDANSNIGSNYSGWIDLFAWATSGIEAPSDYDDGLLRNYMPYSISTESGGRSSGNNKYGYGPSYGNGHPHDLTGDSRFLDWGYAYSLNTHEEWRTLTSAEFLYLLNDRLVDNIIGHKGEHYDFDYVVCNDVYGLLVYPDGYTNQLRNLSSQISEVPAGCVFLPAAGWRSRVGTENLINPGFYYWTSSAMKTTDIDFTRAAAECATVIYFNPTLPTPRSVQEDSKMRYVGNAVRLVCDVNN